MKKLPLKRSEEYKKRITYYTSNLNDRYGDKVAKVFLESVEAAEKRLRENCFIGTDAPYILAGEQVVLKELYFKAGPVSYCLIFEITGDYVGIISLWHGRGSRKTGNIVRLWDFES